MNPKADREAPKGEQENTPWTSLHNAPLPGCPSILLVIGLRLYDHVMGMIIAMSNIDAAEDRPRTTLSSILGVLLPLRTGKTPA
jgi:hypothetical protein